MLSQTTIIGPSNLWLRKVSRDTLSLLCSGKAKGKSWLIINNWEITNGNFSKTKIKNGFQNKNRNRIENSTWPIRNTSLHFGPLNPAHRTTQQLLIRSSPTCFISDQTEVFYFTVLVLLE